MSIKSINHILARVKNVYTLRYGNHYAIYNLRLRLTGVVSQSHRLSWDVVEALVAEEGPLVEQTRRGVLVLVVVILGVPGDGAELLAAAHQGLRRERVFPAAAEAERLHHRVDSFFEKLVELKFMFVMF